MTTDFYVADTPVAIIMGFRYTVDIGLVNINYAQTTSNMPKRTIENMH